MTAAYTLLRLAISVAERGTLGERDAFGRIARSRLDEYDVRTLVDVCEWAEADPQNETGWIEREGLEDAA